MCARNLDPKRVRKGDESTFALEREHRPRQRGRTQHRRIGPVSTDPRERLAQNAAIERRVVRDHHPSVELPVDEGEHLLERRRIVDHLLGDTGEPLDPAAQGCAGADQRGEPVVEVTASHQHGADLGQLAVLATEAVRLCVDHEKLGGRDR